MLRIPPVEDNTNNIHMITRRLRKQGYEAIVVENGADGMTMTRAMPLHVADIALSVYALAYDLDGALSARCGNIFFKPGDLRDLLARSERCIPTIYSWEKK